MVKLSTCCGAERTDDEFQDFCATCKEHTGWEEICPHCDLPALLDGNIIKDAVAVVDVYGDAWHISCVEGLR